MKNPISMTDYCFDWAYKDKYLIPKSVPGHLDRTDFIGFCAASGMDGVDLSDMYWHDCSAAQIKRMLEDASLSAVSYLIAADVILLPDEQRAGLDRVCQLMQKAAGIGTPFVFLVPGKIKAGVSLDRQREWLVDGLRACAQFAQALGLTLLCENIDDPPLRKLMGTGEKCVHMCRQVDHPHFRLIYDAGAALAADEDPLETLNIMAPFVAYVHLKNFTEIHSAPWSGTHRRTFRSDAGKTYAGALLQSGCIDIPGILRELEKISYQGGLMIEYQGEDDPVAAAQQNLSFLRKLMAKAPGAPAERSPGGAV